MHSLPSDIYLKFNNNTLYDVRKMFDLHKPGAMDDALSILDEWLKKQHHFVRTDFDRNYLELTIILSKGSVERAKERLDRACTLRTLMPDVFGVFDIKKYYAEGLIDINCVVLPKMTKDNQRVVILRNCQKNMSKLVFRQFTQSASMLAEYVRRHDYAASYHLVVDYSDINIAELIPLLTFHDLQEFIVLLLDCGGFRVGGIYLISAVKLISIVAQIIKQCLSAKIADRLFVVKDYTKIYERFGDILPEEYGGKEKSLQTLHDEWLDVLTTEEHCNYLRKMSEAKTDEALRSKDKFIQNYMGLPGTFRTLSVD